MSLHQLLPKGIWLIPFLLLFTSFNATSQNETGSITITGKITDEKGGGVPGATVQVKGTARNASAKEDGSFSINVVTGKETLIISSVGFTTKEFPLNGENKRCHSTCKCQKRHA
jgi:TonB-dependent starch-binding outer membrane protein SusC